MYLEGESYIGGDNDESMHKINENDDELNNSMDNPRRSMKKHKSAENDDEDGDNNGNLLTLSKNKSSNQKYTKSGKKHQMAN